MGHILLAAFFIAASTTAFADDWSKQWSVSGSPELHVEAGDGSVHLIAGTSDQIAATVTTKGWKIGPGEVTISERQVGSRVEFEVHVPKMHYSNNVNRSIRVDIRLPRDTATFVHTGDGSIEISGLHGEIQARTGDGSIEAHDIEGSLQAHTGDGHITIKGRMDVLSLETGDGSIEAELSSGSTLASGWRMQTGDGHVTVRLPQGINANLDAHTGDGSVKVDLPITTESISKEHHDVRGKINGGGETLTIRSGDGSIHIEHT